MLISCAVPLFLHMQKIRFTHDAAHWVLITEPNRLGIQTEEEFVRYNDKQVSAFDVKCLYLDSVTISVYTF